MKEVKAKVQKAVNSKQKLSKASVIAANKAAGKSTGPVDQVARAARVLAEKQKQPQKSKAGEIRPTRPVVQKGVDRDVAILDAVLKRMREIPQERMAKSVTCVMKSLAVQYPITVNYADPGPGNFSDSIVLVSSGDTEMSVLVKEDGTISDVVNLLKVIKAENDAISMWAVIDPREDTTEQRKAHAVDAIAMKKTILSGGRALAGWIVARRHKPSELHKFGITIKNGANALLRENGYAAYAEPLA